MPQELNTKNIVYQKNTLCYEDYCLLRKSAGWSLFSREQTMMVLTRSICTVTASENGQAVGMGRLTGDGIYLMITDVVVSPAFQKKGIGSKIINMLIEHARKELPVSGKCCIQLISEKGKEPFYEKLGFETIPNDHCGSGMRMMVYVQ